MRKPVILVGNPPPIFMVAQLDPWLWIGYEAHATFRAEDGTVWTCRHYGAVNTWTQLPESWARSYAGGAA